MRSIRRRLNRSETTSASTPRSRRRLTVTSAARSKKRSSATLAVRRNTSSGPSLVTAKTSDPRLQHRYSWPLPCGRARNWPSTLPTWVPVTTITWTPAAQISSMRSRTLEASAWRSGTAVPSQSNTIASKVLSQARALPRPRRTEGRTGSGTVRTSPAGGTSDPIPLTHPRTHSPLAREKSARAQVLDGSAPASGACRRCR